MGKKRHTTRRMYRKRREEKENQCVLNYNIGSNFRCKRCGEKDVTFINGICLSCTFGDDEIIDDL